MHKNFPWKNLQLPALITTKNFQGTTFYQNRKLFLITSNHFIFRLSHIYHYLYSQTLHKIFSMSEEYCTQIGTKSSSDSFQKLYHLAACWILSPRLETNWLNKIILNTLIPLKHKCTLHALMSCLYWICDWG